MASRSKHYNYLKKKWTKRSESLHKKLIRKHGESIDWLKKASQNVMIGSAASLLLAQPAPSAALAQSVSLLNPPKQEVIKPAKTVAQLIIDLAGLLPKEVAPLTPEQEEEIGKKLSDYFGMPVSAVLQGKRLNRSYGLIGAEQHLMRYPGDVVENMAPGRGAYGYFTSSQETLTQKDIDRERYYIAVQTFLAPGWKENPIEYYNFFRYRKMLVVNAENGKAMITDIADAGPAEFTGKHLGGSPEVMEYLERQDGAAKGPVLYFFIDDPEDKVPLGPITIK